MTAPTAAPARTRTLTARDVMSSPALTIPPDSTPWTAWSLMSRYGIRHLVVTHDHQCAGVLEDREIFAQWPMGPLALRRMTIASMMRPRTSAVLPDTPLKQVAHVMSIDRVDAVPVVDQHGTVLGLITASDLVNAVAKFGLEERLVEDDL